MTLDQFIKKYEGKTVGYPHGSYTGECLSLVKWYIKEVFNINPPPSGCNAARCYWSKFPDPLGAVFKKVPNTPDLVPKRGWIAVWNGNTGGGYGHIAIVLDADVNQFTSFDQNYYGRHAHKQKHNYNNVYGFLAPKKETMSDTIQLKKSKFEELVNKSTKYDSFVEMGYDKPEKIKEDIEKLSQDHKKCELAKSEMGDKVRDARERIESLEEELKTEKASKAQYKGQVDRLKEELEACEARPTKEEKPTEAKMFKLVLYLSISGGIGYVLSNYVANDPELFKIITPITNLVLYYIEQQVKVLKGDLGLKRIDK